jgi:hypothetical protein
MRGVLFFPVAGELARQSGRGKQNSTGERRDGVTWVMSMREGSAKLILVGQLQGIVNRRVIVITATPSTPPVRNAVLSLDLEKGTWTKHAIAVVGLSLLVNPGMPVQDCMKSIYIY